MNLSSAIVELAKRRVITGYSEFCSGPIHRRALLSYLVLPLLPPARWRDRVKFSNRGIAQEIPRALNELGYVVDIVNFDNASWLPSRQYDLFIGHGGLNFERLSRCLSPQTHRIYFATGIYWRELNLRLAERLYNLTKRRGYLLPGYRAVQHDEEYANQSTEGIICLGNLQAVRTFAKFSRVIGINNAIFPLACEGWRDKDYEEGRKHFLFFGGRGSVLKGLDIVLETFAQLPELHLHICQHAEPDFVQVYRHELTALANIHSHGFVQMRSPKFEALARRCNWILSATAAEGQPGAILECMGYGLIPIIPETANIDLDDWGISLRACDIESIHQTVLWASQMSPEECQERSAATIHVTRSVYTVEAFRRNYEQAVSDILTKPPHSN